MSIRVPYTKYAFNDRLDDKANYQRFKRVTKKDLLIELAESKKSLITEFNEKRKIERLVFRISLVCISILVFLWFVLKSSFPNRDFLVGLLLVTWMFSFSFSYSYFLSNTELRNALRRRKKKFINAYNVSNKAADYSDYFEMMNRS